MALALKIERAALLQVLAAPLRAASKRPVVPVLTHLKLQAGGGVLTATGTDLDVQSTTSGAADVEAIGATTVPAQALADVVKKLPADAVVSIKSDGAGRTTVQAGRSRFQLPAYPVEDFPDFTAKPMTHRIEIAGSILATMFGRLQFAISTEETRYYLNGVFCHVVEAEGALTLRMVSTCGHRLARLDTVRASGLALDMPGVIVPRQTVELFKQLAAEAGDATVAFEVSPSLVRLTAGHSSIDSKVIDGTFPDYARVIPTRFARTATAPTLALIEALGRVSTLTGEKVRGVLLDFQDVTVDLSLRNNNDGAEAHDTIDIELDGEPLRIGFNAKYLSEILAQSGGDTVKIKLGDDERQAAVIGDKFAEGLFVLMPLRI